MSRTATTTVIDTVRHAATSFGRERRYAGWLDVDLSNDGEREAASLRSAVRRISYDVIVTSTLRRAYRTAEAIAAGTTPVVRTVLARERCFGVLEGLSEAERKELRPPVRTIRVGSEEHTVAPSGGERLEEVYARARRLRRWLFRRYRGARVLLVSHGVLMQMLHAAFRSEGCLEALEIPYAAPGEIRRFRFCDDRLVGERVIATAIRGRSRW